MGSSNANSNSDTESNARKRVCKACDRCRLKKSKCDGANPCSRCRADNAICVFGERKKSHDKVYPKGYVEMLEQQQQQLVNGLRELYQRTLDGENWTGLPLKTAPNGFPLTHDILERLGALKIEASDDCEPFEDDFDALQRRAFFQEYEMMSPRSSIAESHPSSKRASRAATNNLSHESSLPRNRLPPTPPDQSPTEPSSASFDRPFSPDAVMMDPVSLQTPHNWLQSAECDDVDFLNMDTASYNNMGLLEQKVNPCLSMSAYNEDDLGNFGLSGMLS